MNLRYNPIKKYTSSVSLSTHSNNSYPSTKREKPKLLSLSYLFKLMTYPRYFIKIFA